MSRKPFATWFAELESDPQYWTELATLEVTEEVWAAMERSGISRAELARRLGTSRAYVTQILRGNVNFTLETLARLAHALDGRFRFHIAPTGTTSHWIDVPLPARAPVTPAQFEGSPSPVEKRGAFDWVKAVEAIYAQPVGPVSEIRERVDDDAAQHPTMRFDSSVLLPADGSDPGPSSPRRRTKRSGRVTGRT